MEQKPYSANSGRTPESRAARDPRFPAEELGPVRWR